MPSHLRFDRQDRTGWILSQGPQGLGEIQPDRMSFAGFPDADSARLAAEVASCVLREWQRARRGTETDAPVVSATPDGDGFTFAVPGTLWHAVLFELAQRIHVATRSLRHTYTETV